MLNQFPAWKNCLIIITILVATLYALPNLFGSDPSIQVSALRKAVLDDAKINQIKAVLEQNNIVWINDDASESSLLLRFANTDSQLKAADHIRAELGSDYVTALNLAPATPEWLAGLGAEPMYLGLDLRGGVHFLLEIDMDSAIKQAEERYTSDLKTGFRENKIRYTKVESNDGLIVVDFKDTENLENARNFISSDLQGLEFVSQPEEGLRLVTRLSLNKKREIKKFAVAQNMTTLRNRVNELGVAEPVIQQQGEERIVVQLPGVQDTARAKEILGATATLEFRLADVKHDVQLAAQGRVPAGSKLYRERDGSPVLLKQQIIVTGNQVVDASSGLDQQTGGPMVSVTLDGVGAKKMGRITSDNIGKPMAVVFIESKSEIKKVDGEFVRERTQVEEVINIATIRDNFSKRFQITGLDSTTEARNLALLLRAGALAAPMDIVEERTVGPSLGKDNIEKGFKSVVVGFILVLLFMVLYYRKFGSIADIALAANLVLLFAVLSFLQATLTLPGIAGIVLTVGMAVDANVLIFERIREELKSGSTPQQAIHAGYEKAFSTIFDANLTTLIAAVVLFSFGTGPIKGFAVTLSIGIVTSMFTAILVTRMLINWLYGAKRLDSLSIWPLWVNGKQVAQDVTPDSLTNGAKG
ncbi:MAG: protein translocase subunit SecD [Gammaproteobacteria bacterium]|nr:protein translocase subunit SecD [Gammaproteobacteria bacterium]